MKPPSEEQIHIAIAEWVRWNEGKYPELRLMFHPANGGKRNVVVAKKLKAMLTRPGVPDLMLPWSNGKFTGLALEIKSAKGRLSDHQKAYIDLLRRAGWFVETVFTTEEAISVVTRYFQQR